MPRFLQACLPADLLAKLGDLDALVKAMAGSTGVVVILSSDGSLSPLPSPSPPRSSPTPGGSPAPVGSSPSPSRSPAPGGGSPSPGTYGGQSPRGPTPGTDPSPPEQIRCDFLCTVPAANPGDAPQNCTRTDTGAEITLQFSLCSYNDGPQVPCNYWMEHGEADDEGVSEVVADGSVVCQPTSGTNVCCRDAAPPPSPPSPPLNCDFLCSVSSGLADGPQVPDSCFRMNDTAKARPVDSRCVSPDPEDGYCHKHFMWVVDDSAMGRGMMACEYYYAGADVGFCCLDIALDCQLDIAYACTVRSHGWLMVV
jgi:hypothetical protein